MAPAAAKAAPSSPVIPPSGPTTTSRSPDSGRLRRPRLARGARLEHHRARCLPDQLGHLAGRGDGGDLGYPGAAGLLRGLARGQPPPGQRALSARALPHRHAAGGGPRHDPVHADLGHLLDGQLAPVTLGDGLDDGDRGVRTGHLAPGLHGELEAAFGGPGHHALGHQAGAVGHVGALTRAQPAHGGRVPALGTGQEHDVRFQRRTVGQEDGRLHLVPQPRTAAQRPLKASRSREKNPCWPGANRPGGASSPRSLARSRSSFSCSASSLAGVSTVT